MKKKNIFIALMVILICANVSFSQYVSKTGTTAAPFLKIGAGARGIGMGGAVVATIDDASSMYWNPGALSRINNREAIFGHTTWLLDVNLDYAGVAMDIPGFGTLGAFVNVLSMGDMQVRTEVKPEGTGEMFTAGGMCVGLSFAKNLTENFSIGFNLKYIREYIWRSSAVGFAGDVGILYSLNFLNQTRLGASISNYGTKMKMKGNDIIIPAVGGTNSKLINTEHLVDEYDLPLLFRFGIAVDAIKMTTSRLTLEANAIHPNDNTESVNFGAEYSWNEILFVRGGYNSAFEKESEKGFTLGAGAYYSIMDGLRLKLDYAYQSFNRLKDVHFISVGLKF